MFNNLQRALAVYAGGGGEGGDNKTPIKDKAELVTALEAALAEASSFTGAHGVDPSGILAAEHLQRLKLIGQAVEALVAPDERRMSARRPI